MFGNWIATILGMLLFTVALTRPLTVAADVEGASRFEPNKPHPEFSF